MTSELDPVAIRKALSTLRENRTPWDEAWPQAIPTDHSEDERTVKFMHAHFRAAYHNDHTPKGRCRVDERDVSNALSAARRGPVRRDSCRSGDVCDRPATHGVHGPSFCERHALELSRISVSLADARAKADPRNGGNKSLYTHTVNA